MRAANFDTQTLINYLNGTCKTLAEGVQECFEGMEEDDLTEADHVSIDLEIFRCEQCSWWCEMHEAHESDGEDVCDDCYEGDD